MVTCNDLTDGLRGGSCREALEAEAAVLCTLAKLDAAAFSVAAAAPPGDDGSQISLVVADGVEVVLPLAGEHLAPPWTRPTTDCPSGVCREPLRQRHSARISASAGWSHRRILKLRKLVCDERRSSCAVWLNCSGDTISGMPASSGRARPLAD